MSNFIDYLDWRGDLEFELSPLNLVDLELFCQIIMVDFNGIIESGSYNRKQTLKTVCQKNVDQKKDINRIGLLVPSITIDCFLKMGKTTRFKNIYLYNYNYKKDEYIKCQFGALTIETNDTVVVVFQATDDTLVGWEENVNMIFTKGTPAEEMACAYLNNIASIIDKDKKLIVCGHSKGGHLALYTGLNVRNTVFNRVDHFYNFDGQGVWLKDYNKDLLKFRCEKITEVIPQTSCIGRLFEHPESYIVVESNQKGLLQHNSFTWEIKGPDFVYLNRRDKISREIEEAFHEAIVHLTYQERYNFSNSLFDFLYGTGHHRLIEFEDGFTSMFKSYVKLSRTQKSQIAIPLTYLIKSKGVLAFITRTQREMRKYNKEVARVEF